VGKKSKIENLNIKESPKESSIDFDKDAEDSMQPVRPEINSSMTRTIFATDPGSAAVEEKLNNFSEDFFSSFYDPLHPFHKWIPVNEKIKYFAMIINHQQFKSKREYAREKYYNPNPNAIEGPFVQVGFAGESLPIFE